MTMVEKEMTMMNIANVIINDQDEGFPSNKEEKVVVVIDDKEDNDVKDSNQVYEFEWDGPDKIARQIKLTKHLSQNLFIKRSRSLSLLCATFPFKMSLT